MQPIQIAGYLTGMALASDGGANLRFATQELNQEEFLKIQQYHKSYGWIMFKPNQFDEDDLPKEHAEDDGKSPSKRLRSVMYVLWQHKGNQGDFESYYRKNMEMIINQIKGKLE